MTRFRRPREDRGQILVLFAIALAVLLLMVRLLIDGAMAVTQRRAMQDASDAAAMAAANVLNPATCVEGDPAIEAAINDSLTANGWTSDRATMTWTCAWDGIGVQVTLTALDVGFFGDGFNIGIDSTAINGEQAKSAFSVITLNQTQCNSFHMNGTTQLTFYGDVHINSDAQPRVNGCTNSQYAASGEGVSSWIQMEGDAEMRVRGAWANFQGVTPVQGGLVTDPYGSLAEPSAGMFGYGDGTITRYEETCAQTVKYINRDNYTSTDPRDVNEDGIEGPEPWPPAAQWWPPDYTQTDPVTGEILYYKEFTSGPDFDLDGIYGELPIHINVGPREDIQVPVVNRNGTPTGSTTALHIIQGDLINIRNNKGEIVGDGKIDFDEDEWNDDWDRDGFRDFELTAATCRYYVLTPGVYTPSTPGMVNGELPVAGPGEATVPATPEYMVLRPGVYEFRGTELQVNGGVLCTLSNSHDVSSYAAVASICGNKNTWMTECPSITTQNSNICGVLLYFRDFTQAECDSSGSTTIMFRVQGSSQVLIRQFKYSSNTDLPLSIYNGFLLWFSRDPTIEPGCRATLRGGGDSFIAGTVYGPNTNVVMSGGGVAEAGNTTTQFVVDNLDFDGGAMFTFLYNAGEFAKFFGYGLVE